MLKLQKGLVFLWNIAYNSRIIGELLISDDQWGPIAILQTKSGYYRVHYDGK